MARDDTGPDADGQNEALADDLPLVHVFGSNARVRIVSAMLMEQNRDLTVTDIAQLAGVARSTVYDHIEPLKHIGIIVHTRKVGPAPMYQIDTESEIVDLIKQLRGLTTRKLFEEGEPEVLE